MDFAERVKVSDDIVWVGADDTDLEIFESQYPVEGISYNSYVILDEKITIMDTVDRRGTAQFFDNLAKVLGDNKPSYLIVQHMEPDHAANVGKLAEMYPEMVLVGSMQTQQMLPKYFDEDLFGRFQAVKEGDLVVVLEAMKMENEIYAPCAGTVGQILTSKGATVATGDVLLTIS